MPKADRDDFEPCRCGEAGAELIPVKGYDRLCAGCAAYVETRMQQQDEDEGPAYYGQYPFDDER